ncbi:hypothetical protein P7C70_g1380, partial [Phenoliferia sp. Uapishka_3]
MSEFTSAVTFISTSSAPSSTEQKLRLYALYKISTVSPRPTSPRPALWSFEGRAKWDAWDEEGKRVAYEEGEVGKDRAMQAYVEIARDLGLGSKAGQGNGSEVKDKGKEPAKGMVSVSQMAMDEPAQVEGSSSALHDLAIDGKSDEVRTLLASTEGRSSINMKDSYGYTALHLASDRGHLEVVRALLDAGADQTLCDDDDQTALMLATEAEHTQIIAVLQSASEGK